MPFSASYKDFYWVYGSLWSNTVFNPLKCLYENVNMCKSGEELMKWEEHVRVLVSMCEWVWVWVCKSVSLSETEYVQCYRCECEVRKECLWVAGCVYVCAVIMIVCQYISDYENECGIVVGCDCVKVDVCVGVCECNWVQAWTCVWWRCLWKPREQENWTLAGRPLLGKSGSPWVSMSRDLEVGKGRQGQLCQSNWINLIKAS